MGQDGSGGSPSFGRRSFLVGGAIAAAGASLGGVSVHSGPPRKSLKCQLCFFSKHLPQLGYKALGETLAEMGFDGVDLTVRPRGHVLPERVRDDLPRAKEEIESAGISIPMIATGITSIRDPATAAIIETAGKLGIPFFKLGYYRYENYEDIRGRVAEVAREVALIVELAREHKIQAGFHNHSGRYVGAAMWDEWQIIRNLDPQAIGTYFDAGHATVEGSSAGWKIGLGLLGHRLKMVAMKDYAWEKTTKNGAPRWTLGCCPMGEGIVRWKEFAEQLSRLQFSGPISLHLEYPVPGDTPAEEQHNTIVCARKDLTFIKPVLAESGVG